MDYDFFFGPSYRRNMDTGLERHEYMRTEESYPGVQREHTLRSRTPHIRWFCLVNKTFQDRASDFITCVWRTDDAIQECTGGHQCRSRPSEDQDTMFTSTSEHMLTHFSLASSYNNKKQKSEKEKKLSVSSFPSDPLNTLAKETRCCRWMYRF